MCILYCICYYVIGIEFCGMKEKVVNCKLVYKDSDYKNLFKY